MLGFETLDNTGFFEFSKKFWKAFGEILGEGGLNPTPHAGRLRKWGGIRGYGYRIVSISVFGAHEKN